MNIPDIPLEDERCRDALARLLQKAGQDRETWRRVVTPLFASDAYLVSNLGRVLSLPRYRDYPGSDRSKVHHRKFLPGGILRPGHQPSGHQSIVLTHDKRPFRTHVHRLVAWAFLGPQPPAQHVIHLDGDASNNHVSNLAYRLPWSDAAHDAAHGDSVDAGGISIVLDLTLQRRIHAAVDGRADAIAILREILARAAANRDGSRAPTHTDAPGNSSSGNNP